MRPTLAALVLGSLISFGALSCAADPCCWVYFGTSATDSDRGIYRSKLDQGSGLLSPAVRAADKSNSVFLAFAPDRKHLYSLADVPRDSGKPLEAIETYATDAQTGALKNIGEQVVNVTEACHISVDPSGRCVLTANYGGAYVEVFPILADSTLGARSCIVHHSGSGPNLSRQASAHPHSINVDPSDRFAIVADLGQDTMFVYRLNAATGTL